MKRIIILLIGLIVISWSCSESVEPHPPEFYKIITGKTKKSWKITALKWTGEGKSDVNYTLGACDKDDLYTFYTNTERLYEVSGGSVKCNSTEDALLVSDVWSFVNATATLTIIMPLLSDDPLPFFVQKVTSKEMTLEIFIDQDNTYSYVITMQSVSEE